MHELSVTESILEIALRYANRAEAKRVAALHLVIGQLSSIVDDSVQFYWDIISKDTIAEGATLHFRRIPFVLLCRECDCRYSPGGEDFACPECGSENFEIVSGEEFYLESLDVE